MTQPQAPVDKARARRVLLKRVLGSAAVLALLLLFVPRQEIAAALGRVPPRIWVGALGIYLTLHLIGVWW